MPNYDIHVSLIETRVVRSKEIPDHAIHLGKTNKFNAFKLSRIPTEAILSNAKDSVKGIGVWENENIFGRIKLLKTCETQGLPYELTKNRECIL